MYLTQAIMADDVYMRLRVASCAAQEGCTDVGINPDAWASEWAKVWASAPDWAAAWESAQAGGMPDIGMNPAVITDGMILSQVQAMQPFVTVESNIPRVMLPKDGGSD